MMYPYMTLEDGTEVVHSELLMDGDTPRVLVHFERPTEEGFDSARCELPSYTWNMWEGHFSSDELQGFEELIDRMVAGPLPLS